MDWKLGLIIIPVSDVDRSKTYYADQLGFTVQVDFAPSESFRVVHVIPPGSACAVAFGTGLSDLEPGSAKGMHLMVDDIVTAHDILVNNGVNPNALYHFVDGAQVPGAHPDRGPFETFFDFADPDGNVWVVQEVPAS